jgi:hypothetical protein
MKPKPIQKPAWLLYGESCRERLGTMKATKSGKREEQSINGWHREAIEKYGYKGTQHDWYCLLGWRGRR